ncbi:MAG: YdeI/OmpD-associated family protein [Bauldia sp.]|nr:YdeI/OmpD-associated family protein [Bauldia sp.]MCW5716860.1 YdeI/OmpD-associated family protein [Bauldia sp.]
MADDIPADVNAAMAADSAAYAAFLALPPSHRREYLNWIGEARRTETRTRRIAGMIDRLKLSGTK